MVFQTLYPEELATGKQLCYGECKADHEQQTGIEFFYEISVSRDFIIIFLDFSSAQSLPFLQ